MNAYEIAEIEKSMKADYRLPLSYAAWSDIEREARQARAEATYQAISAFFGSAFYSGRVIGLPLLWLGSA